MDLATGAATAAICRAGASSLAELAAMRVPAVLLPYPAATDNHQFHNARAFESTGAARLLEQKSATPETLAQLLLELIEKPSVREKMRSALEQWHAPHAAEQIAEAMIIHAGVGAGKDSCAHSALAASPGSRTVDAGSNTMPLRFSQAGRMQNRVAAGCATALPGGRVV
jgi:hypothetical protein